MAAVPDGRIGSSETEGISNVSKEDTFAPNVPSVIMLHVCKKDPGQWNRAGQLLGSALERNISHARWPIQSIEDPQDLPQFGFMTFKLV